MAATVRDDITSYFTTYIQPNAIPTLENELLMYRFGEPQPIPSGAGDTVQVQYFSNLTSSTVPVSELVGGFANSISATPVTLRVRFFANDVQFSKLADIINMANWRQGAIGRLIFNAAETADLLARDALASMTTNVQFVNDRASAATFVATDTMNVDELNQAVTTLKVGNVKGHRLTPGRYPTFLHSRVVGDIKGDTGGGSNPNALTWYDFARRTGDSSAIENGRVGSLMGAEIFETNACPRFTTGGAGANVIYYEGFMVGDSLFMTGSIGDLPSAPDSINSGRALIHLIPPARTASTPHDNLWVIPWDFYGAAGLIDNARGVDLFAASNA